MICTLGGVLFQSKPQEGGFYLLYLGEIDKTIFMSITTDLLTTEVILSDEYGEQFKLILRLQTSNDPNHYKNSVITFMKIDEKEWNRLLRNKKVLYKSKNIG